MRLLSVLLLSALVCLGYVRDQLFSPMRSICFTRDL